MTGPLGSSFPEIHKSDGVAILAGGIGVAPFPHAIDRALARGVDPKKIVLIFGSRDESSLYDLPLFRSYGISILLATDDGSVGYRGNVVALLQEELAAGRISSGKPIVACGPERMLEAAARLGKEKKLALFLSLETFMACGIGICNGCAVPVEPSRFGGWPYAKACREGPTFEASGLR